MHPDPFLIILGPTAIGKTALAVNIAAQFNGEIISADSRQVFKGMDIGTGKDLKSYQAGHKQVPYHLINILDAGEKYNVNSFKEDFFAAYTYITAKNKLPILCGGSGMYIHSLLSDSDYTAVPVNMGLRENFKDLDKESLQLKLQTYNPEFTLHADISSVKRIVRAIEVAEFLTHNTLEKASNPKLSPFVMGLYMEREWLRKRIYNRLEQRLAQGLIAEVEGLIKSGVSVEMLSFYGLEYKFIAAYISGAIDFRLMKERLYTAICQFAKRQVTFFRKMEKDGVKITWFDAGMPEHLLNAAVIACVKKNMGLSVNT